MKGNIFSCRRLFLVVSLASVQLSSCADDFEPQIVEKWAHRLGAKIHNFTVQVTGSTAVEKELAKLSLKANQYNGTKLVKDISQKMMQFFNKKIKSLRKIVEKAEQVHEKYVYDNDIKPFPYMDMKNYTSSEYNLTFSPTFKRNVSFEASGIQVPTDIYDEAPEILNTIKWSQSLDEIFIKNFLEDRNLKWQYFGSQTGVFRSYPAKRWKLGPKNIDLYDARKRPWYIHGSTSPKTVVIMVDSSGSMYGRPLLIARLAVGELIDTFSENDYFNIIWFNKDVHYLACREDFVQATPQNKNYYKNSLKTIEANYVAAWAKAFEAAFEMLSQKAHSGAKCQKVIMAFTDGTTERSSDIFDKYNKDKKVRVFTYAVGPLSQSVEPLRAIACENKGYFYRIPGVGSVRDVVKGYISVLSRPMAENNTHDPVWSSVFLDASGLGLMIAGTLPIFDRPNRTGVAKILGVTGTDVPLDDIDNLFKKSWLGANGYFFLINNNGHIVKHPAFKSKLGYLEDPPGVNISDVEFGWEVNSTEPFQLGEKMLQTAEQEVDTMMFDVAKYSDDEFHRRVKKRTMKYFFTTIKETPFRVGIASPQLGFEIVNGSGTAERNGTIINFLKNYWENVSENAVEVFVETYTGTFESSRSNSIFKREQGIKGRLEEYPDDFTVLSVPYNSGKRNAGNSTVTGYRNVRVNASGTTVNLAVVGFNIEYSRFHDSYFIGTSTQGDGHSCNRTNDDEYEGYYCYLLDENAFVVGANAYSEAVTGQFFGKIDSEIMKQLVKGDDSSLSHPLYEKVVKYDTQGTCTDASSSSSSATTLLRPFLSVTSYVKWCTTKAVWFLVQLNLYNWLFSESMSVSAEPIEITKTKNRSCIMRITAYSANVTDANWTQEGKAYCGIGCFGDASKCQRSFVVSKVPKTNIFLLVVNALHGRCATTKADPVIGIPGQPVEVIQSKEQQERSVCFRNPYRRDIARCYTSDNPETDYPCSRCTLVSASLIVFISTLVSVLFNSGTVCK